MKNLRYHVIPSCILLVLCFALTTSSQTNKIAAEKSKAMALANAGQYLEAFTLLEKLAVALPNDVDVITHFGIAVAARSVTFSDPKVRKAERKRAHEVLSKAKALGMTNVMALTFLDQIAPDGGEEDNFSGSDPEVESAMREGEGYFGKGDYVKAREAYLRAYKKDPKNYEAVLFIGDSYYADHKYADAEPWFAKAIALNPDRELAYRFWGDSLLSQDKVKEATEKFIDAFVAEPYSRYSSDNIDKLTRKQKKQFSVITIAPPGTEGLEEIRLRPELLSSTDGTKYWLKFNEVRERWKNEIFKKTRPNEPYRDSLGERAAAFKAVAEAASAAIKAGEIKNPHHSITNVIELNNKGLIESYILLLTPTEGVAEDYEAYRKTNRATLRKFLSEYVFVF